MPWISYAQNREDVLLRRCFGDKTKGFYIDIGASDPTTFSITRVFYEAGWHGINVEASKTLYRRLCKARPRDINLNVAISSHSGTQIFHRAIIDAKGVEASGLSTLNAAEATRHKEDGYLFRSHPVEVQTLAQICEKYAPETIDFLTIDVEGHEEHVLRGANFDRFRPRVILLEATQPRSSVQTHHLWEPILLNANYIFVFFDGLNRYYVRKEDENLKVPLSIPANVFDNYIPWELEREIRRLRVFAFPFEVIWQTFLFVFRLASVAYQKLLANSR